MPRYTLTARHEGRWRWAAVNVEEGIPEEDVIKMAMTIIDEKSQSDDKKESKLWTMGGCTLANPQGVIIWTRPVSG